MISQAATLCAACSMPTTRVCGRCKAAHYCSVDCQKANWAIHNLLCKTYSSFDASSRPTKEHFKAILFPVDKKKPEIIWFDTYESSAITSVLGTGSPISSTTLDYDRVLQRELPLTIHILYRDSFLIGGSKTNMSIQSLCATSVKWSYPFRGPHIAFGTVDDDKEQPDGRNLDMNDFGHIANFFTWYEQPVTIRPRPAPIKVLGVRINCVGDRKMFHKPLFEKVEIPSTDTIFSQHNTSAIADRVGLAVFTRRCPSSPKWAEDRHNEAFGKDPYENPKAAYLHLCLDPKAGVESNGQLGWGWPSYQWLNDVGSVLVVRQDRKPLSPFDIEALCKYCQDEVYPLFEHNTGEFAEKEPSPNSDLLTMICQPMFAIKWRKWQDEKPRKSEDANAPYAWSL